MCRFTFYLGSKTPLSSLITEPEHSLIKQSFNAKERTEPLNGDGFGVGWYINGDLNPARFRETSPAWNNSNLFDLSRATYSGCVIAHVRAATQGNVSENNCHPFKFDNMLMAHNGTIKEFLKIRRKLLEILDDDLYNQIQGNTDSEHFFGLYTKIFRELINKYNNKFTSQQKLEVMGQALHQAILEINKISLVYTDNNLIYLNCVITDGRQAVISRFATKHGTGHDSLYINQGQRYSCNHGVSSMEDDSNKEHQSVIISSEPLCNSGNWKEVPKDHVLLVDEDLSVKMQPIVI